MIIRLLLIASVLAMLVVMLRATGSARQMAIRRIALLCFAAAWVAAVLSPSALTSAANVAGVGRGTDLLLYVLVVAVLLMAVGLNQRIGRLEERLLRLTRELALQSAERRGRDDDS